MKKMLRIAAAFAALFAMTNFIACSSDDDGGDDGKNGLENTYWTMEDISNDTEDDGVSFTYKNVAYVHIEDSSKGTAYIADSSSIDYEKLDLTKTNSVNIPYSSEKETFTYVVDGSKITITSKYKDDAGQEKTEIIEGTLSSDKKSFTTTETEDGETVTTTYTKVDKAPSNATLVIKVAGSDVAVTEVKITSTATEVTAGETITLTATVSPENATDKTVTWTSSDETVATVKDGLVTGVKAGTAIITAKAGEKTATFEVIVKAAAATINASWDFNVASLKAAGLTTTAAKPSADAEIAVSAGSGAKLTLLAQTGKSLKIQNAESGGLNIGAGTAETEVLSITVDEACKLKLKGKGSSGSSFATTKPNSFSVDGNQIYTRASADETTEQEWTYTISEAGTYKIAASGMIFTALACE